MARKKPKEKPAAESEEDESFSVILGTRRKRPREAEEKEEEPKPAPEPVPKEPIAGEAPAKKPAEERSLDDLLKKSGELEMFLTSLEDAHKRSRLPEYTYQRIKKNNELELEKVKRLLRDKGVALPAGKPGKIAAGKGGVSDERVEKLTSKIGMMESALSQIPLIKSKLSSLDEEIGEYRKVIQDIRSAEKSLAQELAYIRRSHTALAEETKKEATPARAPETLKDNISVLSEKLDMLSQKVQETFGSLKSKIDEISVIEDVETGSYLDGLKKKIDDIHSELSDYVKKEELKGIVEKPAAAPEKNAAGKAAKTQEAGIVSISDLHRYVGRDVTLSCSISLLKSIEKRGMEVYWYWIKDKTGEIIMTSCEKITAKQAKITGTVKTTKTGSVYVLLKSLA